MIRKLAIMVMISASIASSGPSRKALLIGNDAYLVKPLRNAVNDAKALGTALSSIGYATYVQLDLNREMLQHSIADFAEQIQPGDTALVFYSGHGLQSEGQNYLIPTDFRVTSEADVKTQGYALADILNLLGARGASTKIVILDACRNNPFVQNRSLENGWAAVQPVQASSAGTFIAFGTAPGSVASDNAQELNGLFTKMILRYLSQPLEIYELFQRVRADVIRDSGGLQVPWVASSLISEFHLMPIIDDTSAGAKTAELPAPGLVALDAPSQSTTSRSIPLPTRRDPAVSVNILVREGVALAQHEDYEEAVRSLSEALTLDPSCSIARRLLGLIFHILGKTTDAVKEYDQALSIDPLDYRAYYYRCLVTASRDPASAARDCGASMGLQPNFAGAHFGLATSLFSLGQMQQSYAEVSRSLSLSPHSGVAYALRGKISTAIGKRAAADRDFHTAAQVLSASGPQ
jgi:uncharacterized caspase-like protein